MADERKHDDTHVENPVEETAETTAPKHDETQPENNKKPHKVEKEKREAPQWLKNIGAFFKTLFVTPWALLQKIMLRIAGGKELVKEAEAQIVADAKNSKVNEAQEQNAKFMEREINDLLKEYTQDKEYCKGLHITAVEFGKNVTGDSSILHTITVTCHNDNLFGGEYQLHLGSDGQLRYNEIVPDVLQMQLSNLISRIQLKAAPEHNGGYDENGDFHGFDEDTPGPANPTANETADKKAVNGTEVDVQFPNGPAAPAVITLKVSKVDEKDATVDTHEATFSAENQSGRIFITGTSADNPMASIDACNSALAYQVYQNFRTSLTNAETTNADVLGQAFNSSIGDVVDMVQGASKMNGSAMIIIPLEGEKALVIDAERAPKDNALWLNAYRIDTTPGQSLEGISFEGAEKIAAVRFPADMSLEGRQGNALNTRIMQLYCAAAGVQSYQTQSADGQPAWVIAAQTKEGQKTVDIPCAHFIPEGGGLAVQSEKRLSATDLRALLQNIPEECIHSMSPTDETWIAANRTLQEMPRQTQAPIGDGSMMGPELREATQHASFARYFVVDDTVIMYTPETRTLHLESERFQHTVHLSSDEMLDADRIATAYEELSNMHNIVKQATFSALKDIDPLIQQRMQLIEQLNQCGPQNNTNTAYVKLHRGIEEVDKQLAAQWTPTIQALRDNGFTVTTRPDSFSIQHQGSTEPLSIPIDGQQSKASHLSFVYDHLADYADNLDNPVEELNNNTR